MHPLTRRIAGGVLVPATILAATMAAGAAPAGAEDGGPGTRGPIDHSGSRTGDGYTAAAALLSVDGPGSSGGDLPAECVVPTRPDEPAHVGRLYSGPGPDGSYLVIIYCDVDGPFPYRDPTFSVTYFAGFVTSLDPQGLVEHALADLHLDPAVIKTDPGDGLNSLTGLATYLWIDRLSLGEQTGPTTLVPCGWRSRPRPRSTGASRGTPGRARSPAPATASRRARAATSTSGRRWVSPAISTASPPA